MSGAPYRVSSPGLELETPSLVPVKKNASAVVVSDKYNLKPIPLKRQRCVLGFHGLV